MILLNSIIWFAACVATAKKLNKGKLKITLLGFLLLNAIFSTLWFVSNYFTGKGFDESVIFHLKIGLSGGGGFEYTNLIIGSFGWLLFVVVFLYYCFKEKSADQSTWLALILVASVLLSNPLSLNVYDRFGEQAKNISPLFVDARISPHLVGKKNIVYLYVESLENAYLDDSIFPDLMPNLKSLTREGVYFSNIKSDFGSGWTVAGMVASQCGIPLVAPKLAFDSSVEGYKEFYRGAYCIGDILSNTHRLEFYGGANPEFGGKKNFLKTHGFTIVNGRDEISPDGRLISSWWGLPDSIILPHLENRYQQLLKIGSPFALFGLTLNTHHPDGVHDPKCHNLKYKDGSSKILNNFKCVDELIKEFINNAKLSHSYKDTLFVIAGDHISMKNSVYDRLQAKPRSNFLLFLNSGRVSEVNHRVGSTMDIGSTILDLLGDKNSALGFGRSLFQEEKNITELYVTGSEKFLSDQTVALQELWDFDTNYVNTLKFDYKKKYVDTPNGGISFPVILIVADDNSYTTITSGINEQTILSLLRKGSNKFYYFDDCLTLENYALRRLDKAKSCILVGEQKNGQIKLNYKTYLSSATVGIDSKFDKEIIMKDVLSNSEFQKEIVNFRYFKTINVYGGQFDDVTSYIQSSGFNPIADLKKHETENTSFIFDSINNFYQNLGRGLNIVAFDTKSKVLTLLENYDTCQPSFPHKDFDIDKVIERNQSLSGRLYVVASDSAVCEVSAALFLQSKILEKAGKICYRCPYIAEIRNGVSYREYIGREGENIVTLVNK